MNDIIPGRRYQLTSVGDPEPRLEVEAVTEPFTIGPDRYFVGTDDSRYPIMCNLDDEAVWEPVPEPLTIGPLYADVHGDGTPRAQIRLICNPDGTVTWTKGGPA